MTLAELMSRTPHPGTLCWIGLRPARRAAMAEPAEAVLDAGAGLVGDRYAGRGGERHVTLMQAEHLDAIARFVRRDAVAPSELRRNLLVSGVNLLALKGRRVRIGSVATLEITGLCHPCSRMESTLGPGGYNAMRGHGGLTARVVVSGTVRVGDPLEAIAS